MGSEMCIRDRVYYDCCAHVHYVSSSGVMPHITGTYHGSTYQLDSANLILPGNHDLKLELQRFGCRGKVAEIVVS